MTQRQLQYASLLFGLIVSPIAALGQSGLTAPAAQQHDATEARLDTLSRLLTATQQQLEDTQRELMQMRAELEELRGAAHASGATPSSSTAPAAGRLAEQVVSQQEQQEILAAEVKQHDQTKLESASKYPVRVYGLVLFNTYSNAGVVDNADLPSIAIPRSEDVSHGSIGGSLRQSLFGITANGPSFLGARSSADISLDLFGGSSYSYYASSNGSVRFRRGDIGLSWGATDGTKGGRDELHVGVDAPLISPLSPTSYATVAEPALAWSGNLWTWAPELQYRHTFSLSASESGRSLQVEGGLWDPPAVGSAGATAARVLSAGELSRRPGFLGRTSFHAGSSEHPFAIGVGGYSDRQTFYEGQQIQMWAVTGDWRVPLSRRFELQGEVYRGRGLGGLGGGVYKDVLTGTDRITGLSRTLGLNAAGGWSQLKAQLFHGSEANVVYGQDGGFSSDFRQLTLSGSSYVLEQSARNQMIMTNFIYRPRTYIIVSPEYRRILSWKTYGPSAVANVFTLSLGYQF
jgi:hypothetical protein